MSIPEDCQYGLYELKREIRWWRSSFGNLGLRLQAMIEFTQKMSKQQGVCSEAVDVILPKLWSLQEKITESGLDDFIKAHGDARKILQAEPDKDSSGSFYNMLHSFWNNVQPVLSHSKEIRRIIEKCIAILKEAPTTETDTKKLLQDLEECSKTIETDGITEQTISTVKDKIARWESIIPEAPLKPGEVASSPLFISVNQVVIIEDQQVWSEPIREVIVEAFPYLKDEIVCLKTYEEANMLLKALKTAPRTRRGLLVILDLGLPKDESELKSGKCSRDYGKDLLLKLRSYQLNIRTVLLTSHFNFLDDHLWALNNGIQPEDYIWKGQENYKQHVQSCIERLNLREGGVGEIKIIKQDNYGIVRIEGIEVPLEPLYFKVFYVLCTKRLAHSCKEILGFLLEPYTDTYDEFKNIDPERIHDYVYEIRRKIHEAFTRAGRFVNTGSIIETQNNGETKYGIRRGITKTIVPLGGKKKISICPAPVLVIENDVHWCNKVRTFLNGLGYETIVAHSVEEALETVKKTQTEELDSPAWLCLDMHIPKTRKEWEMYPQSGRIEGGLDALKKIREELKDMIPIGAVVLTAHYEKDNLRQLVIQNGVDINHWVPKDENWKDNLAYAAWRLSTEFKLGIKMPVEDDPYSHLRIQLRESDRRNIVIDGVEICLTPKQQPFFWALAERRGRAIQRDELLKEIYGENVEEFRMDMNNALNQLVKYTKKAIGTAMQRAGKEIDPKEIIAEMPGGYRLKGLIFIIPSSDVH